MAVAIVAGSSILILVALSGLLTPGSRRRRLLSRIERQVGVLKDLPLSHPSRAALDDALMDDVNALRELGTARSNDLLVKSQDRPPSGASMAAALGSLVALLAIFLALLTYQSGTWPFEY